MTRQRWDKPPDYKRNEAGCYQCVFCEKELKRKLKYCNDQCRFQVYARCYPGTMRELVLRRDKGICALCGCDTLKIERVFRYLMHLNRWWQISNPINILLMEMGFNRLGSGAFWEADHITPWADGGSNEPENIRTLCVPCHKAVTKQFAAERAARNREAQKAAVHLPLFTP